MIRLFRALVLGLVLLFGGVLDAAATTHPVDYPATQKWGFYNGSGVSWVSSFSDACQGAYSRLSAGDQAYYGPLTYSTSPTCATRSYTWSASISGPQWMCEDNSQAPLKDGAYVCTKMVEDVPPVSCTKGQKGSGSYVTGTGSLTSETSGGSLPHNDGKCMFDIDEIIDCWSSASGSVKTFSCDITYTLTGESVVDTGDIPSVSSGSGGRPPGAPGAKMPPTPAPDGSHCPAGSVAGGVDSGGITICIGSGTHPDGGGSNSSSSTTTKPATTTTGSDGSTVKSQDTVTHNSDGSDTTTTTTETTHPDGSKDVVITTSTSNKPDGSLGKPNPNPDQQDFCKLHPDLTICGNSSVSGACGDISCMGDAIQCATLRAAAQIQCKQKQDEDDLKASGAYSLGNSVMSGNDPQSGSLPTKDNATRLDLPSSLDASGWLGGGSCFADKSVSVQGHTFVISFSKACDYLVAFRYALMAVAMLVSFRMLSGVILRD